MFPKNKRYQLVIVGAGLSGLSAAVAGKEKGLKDILVLEKGRTVGGDGNYVEGAMGVDSYLQKQNGINIDPIELLKSELEYSHYEASAPVLRKFIEQSGAIIDWLHDEGVKFVKVGKQGESWPTIHTFAGRGAAVVKLLYKKALDLGVEFVKSTSANKLIVKNGQIAGLIVKSEVTGQKREVETEHVILATGGYVDNSNLVAQRIKDDRLMPVSDGKSTGDGMQLAWQVGAKRASMGAIQYGGGAIFDKTRPQFVHMPTQLAAAATQEALLWVNESGDRFVNEDVNDNMCHAGAAILTQSKVYSIMDQGSIDDWINKGLYKEVGNSPVSPDKFAHLQDEINQDLSHHEKYLVRADSIKELGEELGLLDLEKTINDYNQLVKQGKDSQFGKAVKYLNAIKKAPYYAVQLGVGMACALGGIRVDTDNAVLNDYGFPIPGLYAIGNDAAGMLVGDTYAVTLPGSTAGFASYSAKNAINAISKNI